MTKLIKPILTRRKLLGTGAAALASAPLLSRYAQAQSSEPIKIGFQVHRTGIGASYGRWYDRTTQAAVKRINDMGGINGRPVEVISEDDGTDPKRGAEVVEKLAAFGQTQHMLGPQLVQVDGDGASVRTDVQALHYLIDDPESTFTLWATYLTNMRREGAVWKIARHELVRRGTRLQKG